MAKAIFIIMATLMLRQQLWFDFEDESIYSDESEEQETTPSSEQVSGIPPESGSSVSNCALDEISHIRSTMSSPDQYPRDATTRTGLVRKRKRVLDVYDEIERPRELVDETRRKA